MAWRLSVGADLSSGMNPPKSSRMARTSSGLEPFERRNIASDTYDDGYFLVSRDALRDFSYGPFVANDIIAADAAAATVLPRQAGAAAMVYGHAASAAERIGVPILLAFG